MGRELRYVIWPGAPNLELSISAIATKLLQMMLLSATQCPTLAVSNAFFQLIFGLASDTDMAPVIQQIARSRAALQATEQKDGGGDPKRYMAVRSGDQEETTTPFVSGKWNLVDSCRDQALPVGRG